MHREIFFWSPALSLQSPKANAAPPIEREKQASVMIGRMERRPSTVSLRFILSFTCPHASCVNEEPFGMWDLDKSAFAVSRWPQRP